MPDTPLAKKLKTEISAHGPLSIARFMDACLADPTHGYYRTRDPLGAGGDFITAPEISQIFGELIGLWCVEVWRSMGSPAPLQLVELGPGRGTLMADAMRASAVVPGFEKAACLHLVETSPVLRQAQQDRLAAYSPHWHETIDDVTPGATLVIANEFLDALPIRQLVRRSDKWFERCVGTDNNDALAYCERDYPCVDQDLIPAETAKISGEGAIAEIRPDAATLIETLGARATTHPLVALFVDYGHARSAPGDTFQAISSHGYANPLDSPGECDLTAHVDFHQLAETAAATGLRAHGPLSQRDFLLNLGLAQRCEQLVKNVDDETARAVARGAERLVDAGAMGMLFKVLALGSKGTTAPPPFEP